MPLAAGVRLGPYEIVSAIGAGGMGEVYRARDQKLGRDVAIKVLPPLFTADADRLARFKREARVLATLNHPNIGAIYGFEELDGIHALVLELVEGETLADKLNGSAKVIAKPLQVPQALEIARQVAEALDAAHEKGIVHRDLKPANIKVTPDGRVKVLDFGLAKTATTTEGKVADSSEPSTITVGPTGEGMIVGTTAYMSPEQARGQSVDKRSDIWAFGCVLYEMLTGRPVFSRETVSDTIAAILEHGPDWGALPEKTPPAIRSLLRRCLVKDPKRRLRDIGDASIELGESISPSEISQPRAVGAPRIRRWQGISGALLAGVLLLAGGFALFLYFGTPTSEMRSVRFGVPPPSGSIWAPTTATQTTGANTVLAVSPDGRYVAYTAQTRTGTNELWIRSLDAVSSQPLAGTDRATSPFWSPDSRSVAFFADGKLKRIEVSGGPVLTLCDAPRDRGATWGASGVILFAQSPGPLQKVPATGGVPVAATRLEGKETYHVRPQFLPDGRHFLYRVDSPDTRRNSYYLGVLDSSDRTLMLTLDAGNVVPASGHLLFMNETTLMAQPFDADRFAVTGDPVPVAEGIQTSIFPPVYGVFSASQTGVLAYLTGSGTIRSRLVWLDRAGRPLDVLADTGTYNGVELSRDGSRAMVGLPGAGGGVTWDLWLFDLQRKVSTSFRARDARTQPTLRATGPVWSPDGSRVVYASNYRGPGEPNLLQKAANGAGAEEALLEGGNSKVPQSWSSDGRFILYTDLAESSLTGADLWVLPLADRKPFPFLRTQFNEDRGRFSPDGRWVAYVSNESKSSEVYVASFPDGSVRQRVSTDGGDQPRWRRDGGELFYLSPDNTLMAAPVTAVGTTFKVGEVRSLFKGRFVDLGARYDVTADGQRFLVNTLVDDPAAVAPMTVVVNWAAGLKK